MLVLLLERAQLGDPLLVILVRAVAEVQPEDVGAGIEQRSQPLGGRRSGADGGDESW